MRSPSPDSRATMSKPSAGSSEGDGSPWPDEGGDGTWKRRIGRQREKRLGIDDLSRKLDDLCHFRFGCHIRAADPT